MSKSRSSRKWILFHFVALTLACLANYWSGLSNDFAWIDHEEILNGAYRVESEEDFAKVWSMSLDQYLERKSGISSAVGGYWRPIYALSISLDWSWWKDDAWKYRLENILWHLGVVLCLYVLGLELCRDHKDWIWCAFFAALLFGTHPLGSHSVTWISGRKDTMCAFFSLVSLLSWIGVGKSRNMFFRLCFLVFTLVAFVLAVLSKELAFVLPAVMILFCFALSGRHGFRHSWAIGSTIGISCFSVLMFWVRGRILGSSDLAGTYPDESFLVNVFTSSQVFWEYVFLVLAPRTALVADTFSIAKFDLHSFLALGGMIVAVGVALFGLIRRKLWCVGLFWWMFWLVPASGIFPLRHFRAERYLYPASWGLIFAFLCVVFTIATHGLVEIWSRETSGGLIDQWEANRKQRRRVAILFCWFCVVWCAYYSWSSNRVWKNDQSLFTDAVNRSPEYVEGLTALAKWELDQGNLESSIQYSETAIEKSQSKGVLSYFSPSVLHTNHGLALYRSGQYREALQAFSNALESRPNNGLILFNIGMSHFSLREFEQSEKAYERALEFSSTDETRGNLALVKSNLGKFDEAIKLLIPVVERNPEDNVFRNNLASTLLVSKRYQQSAQQFKELLQRIPNEPIALAKLAWCEFELGNHRTAALYLQKSLQLDARNPVVLQIGTHLQSRGLVLQ